MIDFDYYTPPSDEIFEDIKAKAIQLWQTYDDTYGYASEKINRIKNIQNIQDNAWYIVGMFDQQNQIKLIFSLTPEAAKVVWNLLSWNAQEAQKILNDETV